MRRWHPSEMTSEELYREGLRRLAPETAFGILRRRGRRWFLLKSNGRRVELLGRFADADDGKLFLVTGSRGPTALFVHAAVRHPSSDVLNCFVDSVVNRAQLGAKE